jgi:hypothetical protein
MADLADAADPIVKIGHLTADLLIDTKIAELRRLTAGLEGRIAELEELKLASLEDKTHALQSASLNAA